MKSVKIRKELTEYCYFIISYDMIIVNRKTHNLKVLKKKEKFDEELLKHISPLGWEHINFLGEYRFNKKEIAPLESLRPLQTN